MGNLSNEYFIQAQSGNKAAQEFVYKYYRKIIFDCLSQCSGILLKRVEFQTYEDAASDALLRAIMTFDVEKGFMFSSYAYSIIKNSIKVVNRDNSTLQKKFDQSVQSLDATYTITDNDGVQKDVEIADELMSERFSNSESKLNIDIMVEKMKELLPQRSFEMFYLASIGYSLEAIGKKYGLTMAGVDKQLSKDRKYIRQTYALANQVYMLKKDRLDDATISKQLNLPLDMVGYYCDMYDYLYNGAVKPKTTKEKEEEKEKYILEKLKPLLQGSSKFDILYFRKIKDMSVEDTMEKCGIKVAPNYLYKQSERARRVIHNFVTIGNNLHTQATSNVSFCDLAKKYNISEDDVLYFYNLHEYLFLDGEPPILDSKDIFERYAKPLNTNWPIIQAMTPNEKEL